MDKNFFDYNDGDYVHAISDNMAMDMEKRDIHFIYGWFDEDEN